MEWAIGIIWKHLGVFISYLKVELHLDQPLQLVISQGILKVTFIYYGIPRTAHTIGGIM